MIVVELASPEQRWQLGGVESTSDDSVENLPAKKYTIHPQMSEKITVRPSMSNGVHLMAFIYPVFTRMPKGVTVCDSGLVLSPLTVERY